MLSMTAIGRGKKSPKSVEKSVVLSERTREYGKGIKKHKNAIILSIWQ